MSGKGKFKSKEVLENAKEIISECTATAFDIVSDHELEHSNLEGHVFAIYSVDNLRYAHVITPYFDDLRTYNVKDYFVVPTNKNYYIADITEYTGKDYYVGEYTPIEEAMEEVGFYEEDKVNQPSHYTSGDIEVIEYIEQQAKVMYDSGTVPPEVIPHICNAIKYISRFQSKGKAVEDLKKSIFYIQRAIEKYDEE